MKISIIIPIYNKSKYLRTILNQVREQSFSDYECLLIDDGSIDGSGAICDEFAGVDTRFKVFHIPNGGVSHARNVGLDNAQGEYITFIDADDEIYLNFLENLYFCIEKSKSDIVVSGFEKFWDYNSNKVYIKHPKLSGVVNFEDCLSTFASVQKDTGLFGCCVSKIFKKFLCKDIRFDENIRLAEDFDFYLRIYSKVKTIYFDEKNLYRYRQEAENSSVSNDDSKIDYLTQLKINLKYRDFLISFNVYFGDNKAILEQKLSDYLYFSAFYCQKEMMNVRFSELSELQNKEDIKYISGNLLQKTVLKAFEKENYKKAKKIILLYRKLRNFIKK